MSQKLAALRGTRHSKIKLSSVYLSLALYLARILRIKSTLFSYTMNQIILEILITDYCTMTAKLESAKFDDFRNKLSHQFHFRKN